MTTTGEGSRPYVHGEDQSEAAREKVVCQRQMGRGRADICNGPTKIVGATTRSGKAAAIYQCERYREHRFVVWGVPGHRRVADAPSTAQVKPTFGDAGF